MKNKLIKELQKRKKKTINYTLDDLGINFNTIIYEENEENEFGKKFLHNKYWAEKIIRISMVLNALSILCIVFGFLFYVTKEDPYVYATTEYGSLYMLPTIGHDEALNIVKNSVNINNNNSNLKENKEKTNSSTSRAEVKHETLNSENINSNEQTKKEQLNSIQIEQPSITVNSSEEIK